MVVKIRFVRDLGIFIAFGWVLLVECFGRLLQSLGYAIDAGFLLDECSFSLVICFD